MLLSVHAAEKITRYGIEDSEHVLELILKIDDELIDVNENSTIKLIEIEKRLFVVVINKERDCVVTIYPSDKITVENRIKSGRWKWL
jgi:hypothetical protein